MSDLPANLFQNPVWHALNTVHRHFALAAGDAVRYPADVAPFAAVFAPTEAAMTQLHSLLSPGETVWLVGATCADAPQLVFEERLECLQMILPQHITPSSPRHEIVQLSDANASEMVALTNLAFPGFFRIRTCEMGSYCGLRSNGELIAMGGERLRLEGHPEISGVCTHPAHRGKGLAESVIWYMAGKHRLDRLTSWLHVGSENYGALKLYRRLGFTMSRKVTLNRISRRVEH